jgi:hypothetical protein
MQKSMLYIILLLFGFAAATAQSIKIVRTDVDSTRSSFVTSTYVFGIDIYAMDVEDCNEVNFNLFFDNIDVVKFSGYENTEFTSNGGFCRPQYFENVAANTASIYVGALSGETKQEATADNPRVIHLEFVVNQSAINNSELTFTITDAEAIVKAEVSPIDLLAEETVYNIHSFMNVWPGDADNNGLVEMSDINVIGLYMGMGSATKQMRSFKRPNASTLWHAQQVLAWDSLPVTYADCDGNGDVTVSDAHVVVLNIGKTHVPGVGIANQTNQIKDLFPDVKYPDSYDRQSLIISSNREVISVSGRIYITGILADEFVGLELSEAFNDENSFLYYKYNEDDMYVDFIAGSFSHNVCKGDAELVDVVIKGSNHKMFGITAQELLGMSKSGSLMPLSHTTAVADSDKPKQTLSYNKGLLLLNNSAFSGEIELKVYTYAGSEVLVRRAYANGNLALNIGELPLGTYLLFISDGENYSSFKFVAD